MMLITKSSSPEATDAHAIGRQRLHGREDGTLVHGGEHETGEERRQRRVGAGLEEEGRA